VSGVAHAADLAAGLGLLAAGLIAWLEPATSRLGPVAALAGVVWFAPDWEGWDGGPAFARSVGAVTLPLFGVLVLHLVLAAPRGRVAPGAAWAMVVVGYAVALGVGIGWALVRNPVLDLYCWRNCLDNVFLVHEDPGLARALGRVWLVALLLSGVLLLATGVARSLGATAAARRPLLPLLVSGALVGGVQAATAAALLRTPLEDPRSSEFSSLFLARALAVTALAAALVVTALRAARTRAAVGRLVTELGETPPPGALQGALAAAVGDPTLEIAYRLSSGRYVGGDGKPAAVPAPGGGRAVTSVVREDRELALVVHDAALLDRSALEREIGSAAKLAVENERLRAEVLAQLEDLRASRARVVERGDAERRRLERDLHDGAQQRLLALTYDLRLARAAFGADRDRELATTLASAEAQAQKAFEELRELAHGIFPAILTEAGLAAALRSLADTARVPVELHVTDDARCPDPVETAAYVTVAESIGSAASRRATHARIEVDRAVEALVVEVTDDGEPRDAVEASLVDRVGALGGVLTAAPNLLRVEIPCA